MSMKIIKTTHLVKASECLGNKLIIADEWNLLGRVNRTLSKLLWSVNLHNTVCEAQQCSHYTAHLWPDSGLSDSFACLSAHTDGVGSERAGRRNTTCWSVDPETSCDCRSLKSDREGFNISSERGKGNVRDWTKVNYNLWGPVFALFVQHIWH